jgi:photosystem II stability/assembly factor-like uncharacterized protein
MPRLIVALGVVLACFSGTALASSRVAAPRFTSVKSPAGPSRSGTLRAVLPGARGVLLYGAAISRDGGTTWRKSAIDEEAQFLFGRSPGLVYRFVNGVLSISTNLGQTWTHRTDTGEFADEETMRLDPVDDDTLCVDFVDRTATVPSRLSTDGGRTWRDDPFPCTTTARTARGGPLVAAIPYTSSLERSTDGGVTWTPMATDLPATQISSITSDPSRPQSLYADQFHSADGGTHWTAMTIPAALDRDTIQTALFDPAHYGTLVISQAGHLWLSRDIGATWALSPRTLPMAPAGFDAAGTLYVLTPQPMRSTNDGFSWTWHGRGLHGVTPGPVSVDPVTGRVYMLSTGGLLRLQPDGRSWKALSPFGASPLGLAGMSSSFGALGGTILLPSPLVRSTDGGASFEDASLGEIDQYQLRSNAAVTPVGASSIVAIVPYQDSVLLSPDLGVTWTEQPGSPTVADDNFSNPTLVTGTTSSLLSAGNSGEIWRSDDLGMTWQPWHTVTPSLEVIAATPSAVYLLSTTTAIGQRLNVLTPGSGSVSVVLPHLNVERVVVSSEQPRLAVALGTVRDHTEDLRAYVTRDAGATWKRLQLPAKAAPCADAGAALTPDGRLVVSLDGPRLYADLDPPTTCSIASVRSTPLV